MIPYHTLGMVEGGAPAQSGHITAGIFSERAYAASANAVTAAGTVTPGTGFTSVRTVTVEPSGGTGSGLTARAKSLKVVDAALATDGAGTGYAANDTIDLGNGVTITVNTITGSAIATFTVTAAGTATDAPENPVAQVDTSGSGTGAKFDLTWGLGEVEITNSGSYTAAPSMTVTDSADGTGASVGASTLGGDGNAVVVGFPVGGEGLPDKYAVFTNLSNAGTVAVDKANDGFLVKISSSTTVAAGTLDALLIA